MVQCYMMEVKMCPFYKEAQRKIKQTALKSSAVIHSIKRIQTELLKVMEERQKATER